MPGFVTGTVGGGPGIGYRQTVPVLEGPSADARPVVSTWPDNNQLW